MEKILKFKQEVLDLKIYSQIDYYPGNPYYIGKSDDERLKKSIEESNYKEFLSEKNQSLYKELTSNEPISQYYVELADEAALFDLLEEALYSTDDFSKDDLKVAFDLLASYKYDAFLEELDLLYQKFLNVETTKEDQERFKALCRKQFGYAIPKDGRITAVFVSDLSKEMKMRVENLKALKEMIEKVIAIKDVNEASAFARSIGLEFFPSNDPEVESCISSNIERRQVKPLFDFIDFLYFNRAEFIEYNSFVGEYERLKIEREKMSSSNNYKTLIAKKELDHKIEAKKVLIHTNIAEPIIKKLEYLDVNEIFDYDTDSDSTIRIMSGIEDQKKYCTQSAFELIKLYEERYVEFREATKYNQYDSDKLFEEVDNLLENLFSFVHEDEVSKLKVSKEKHLERIGALSIKPATDNILHFVPSKTNFKKGGETETHTENKTSITAQTKSLFNFIDYLHSNIDHFNQYLDDIYDMNREVLFINTSATHFTNVRESKNAQKEVAEKWNLIFKNIVAPIKEKVEELDVFNWYKPETLLKKHMPLVSWLSKNCKDQDSELVLKAKKQYIQFTNEVGPYVIKQTNLMFKYLNKVMLVIAEDFEEEDDLSIYTEELRVFKTWQEQEEEILIREERLLSFFLDSFNDERENMEEQVIFELITELTKKNYIERDDGFIIDDFTPKGIEYVKIIHFFREIYGQLYKEFRFLFFNGKIELLRRIKILLQKGLQILKASNEDEGCFLQFAYEDGDIESIRNIEIRQHIFETKIYYVETLLFKLDGYVAEKDDVMSQQTIERETISKLLPKQKEASKYRVNDSDLEKLSKSTKTTQKSNITGRPPIVIKEASCYLHNKKLLPFLIKNYSNVKPRVFNQLIKVLVDLQLLIEAENKEYKEAFGKALKVEQVQFNFDKAFRKDPNPNLFNPIKGKIQTFLKQ